MPLIAYCLLLFLHPGYHQPDNNFIDWAMERKLVWNDFKAPADQHSPNAALTSSKITINYSYTNESFVWHLHCKFDKNASWGRVKNDYILSHEQGHFDIAEIYTRKLNKALKEYKINTSSLSQDVNKIYEKTMREHQEMQAQYDEQTKFSIDTQQQEQWLKKIKNQLDELKDYAAYT